MSGVPWTAAELVLVEDLLLVRKARCPHIVRVLHEQCPQPDLPEGRTLSALYSKIKELGWVSGDGRQSDLGRTKVTAQRRFGKTIRLLFRRDRVLFDGSDGQVPRGCRYIIGDIHEAGWRFCQADQAHESYCGEHFVLTHDFEATDDSRSTAAERRAVACAFWWRLKGSKPEGEPDCD